MPLLATARFPAFILFYFIFILCCFIFALLIMFSVCFLGIMWCGRFSSPPDIHWCKVFSYQDSLHSLFIW